MAVEVGAADAAGAAEQRGVELGAALANRVWLALGAPEARRFAASLRDPQGAQERWLTTQLAIHATSEFGQAHGFAALRDAREFARRVPLSSAEDLRAPVARVRAGARDVLACGRVTHLAPTSGSTGARKLIPFTRELQRGFDAAVSPWMHDLARQRPALTGGPAYWSISPLASADDSPSTPDASNEHQNGTVPIGFADDADYLGGAGAWLVRRALAVPSVARFVADVDAFWALTALALLRRRELRLMSVWHPSYVELLVGAARSNWDPLLEAIAAGRTMPWSHGLPAHLAAAFRARPDRARAAELRRIGPDDWPRWWPRLQVLSCWGEQSAAAGWRRLVERLPQVLVQAKGLLATEGVVTIPYRGTTPLAIRSHFFEFLDATGEPRVAHELERGQHYEVVLTNGGGLWRYRLGDVVECAGHLGATPTLRFLGRAGRGSDLRGEKLSEVFVAEVLRGLWSEWERPAYAALRAWVGEQDVGYELLVSDPSPSPALGPQVERALSANPHYALARKLGQLAPVRVVSVPSDFSALELAGTTRALGDTKPLVLLPAVGGAP